MNDHLEAPDFRLEIGELILDLMDADQFASFRWKPLENKYDDGVIINLSENNIVQYEEYYQYHDPITRPLAMRKKATTVSEIIPQKILIKTEFYNDFLRMDGLYHGINLHLYDDFENNIGDFRIWKKKGKEAYDERSCQLLDILKPHLIRATKHNLNYQKFGKRITSTTSLDPDLLLLRKKYSLTPKEIKVTLKIIQGVCDDQAATQLFISKTTLRTHLKHIFKKTNVKNRTELSHLISST